MQKLQLGWQPAAVLSAALFAGAAAARVRPVSRVVPYLREAGLVAALYALWQLAGSVPVLSGAGAFEAPPALPGGAQRPGAVDGKLAADPGRSGRPASVAA